MHSTPRRAHFIPVSSSRCLHPGVFAHLCKFTPRISPQFQGAKALHPLPQRPTEWSFWNPFGSDRRGPKHTRAEQKKRLGRLRYTRQGLVRVSESNTKYGGKRRKTGVSAAPVIDPSISESKRIPKQKKCSGRVDFRFAPCSQGNFFFGTKDCVSKTHVTPQREYEQSLAGMSDG